MGSRPGIRTSPLMNVLLPALTWPMTAIRHVRRARTRSMSSTNDPPRNGRAFCSSRPHAISSRRRISSSAPIWRVGKNREPSCGGFDNASPLQELPGRERESAPGSGWYLAQVQSIPVGEHHTGHSAPSAANPQRQSNMAAFQDRPQKPRAIICGRRPRRRRDLAATRAGIAGLTPRRQGAPSGEAQ